MNDRRVSIEIEQEDGSIWRLDFPAVSPLPKIDMVRRQGGPRYVTISFAAHIGSGDFAAVDMKSRAIPPVRLCGEQLTVANVVIQHVTCEKTTGHSGWHSGHGNTGKIRWQR